MTKKTTRTRAEAKRLMWEYYRTNKEWLPGWICKFRDQILTSLILGDDAGEVFNSLIAEGNKSLQLEVDLVIKR